VNKIKGIIFDMDNTLLGSSIDFAAMKEAVYSFLVVRGILSEHVAINKHTTSTLIEEALQVTGMDDALMDEVWSIVEQYEVTGMQGAKLEQGVVPLLEQLAGRYTLVIVTNNSIKAAQTAIKDNAIAHYFETVIGRESMSAMKPSSAGFHTVLAKYATIAPEQWISVGDSWIDGRAATDAGITFISYRGDLVRMENMGVMPLANIDDIREIVNYI
jgi:phosphoglycolate phosphatase